jgi:hypothetical protein
MQYYPLDRNTLINVVSPFYLRTIQAQVVYRRKISKYCVDSLNRHGYNCSMSLQTANPTGVMEV